MENQEKSIISDEELAEAFTPDEVSETKDDKSVEQSSPHSSYPDKNKKKRKNIPFIVTLIILIIFIIGGVLGVKFFIIDNKDEEIAALNANIDFKDTIIDQLGVDVNQFARSLEDANQDLKETTDSLKNANSTLNFLLGKSAQQLAGRYLGPMSGWGADFSKYNFFEQGIDNEDFQRYITLYYSYYNSQFEGKYNETTGEYIANLKYALANETYRELFGPSSNLKENKSDIKWCDDVANSYFDLDLYEKTGGFTFVSKYDEAACNFEKTYFYSVDGYESTTDGFIIKTKIAFATKKEAENGGSLFAIDLLDGTTTDWGGPSCRTSSETFIKDNKDNLPTYILNFKKNGDNYYLDSISK